MATFFPNWRPVAFAVLLPATALGHPGSGIGTAEGGRIFFTDTGAGVWAVQQDGTHARVSESAVHWMTVLPKSKDRELGGKLEAVQVVSADAVLVLSSDWPCTATVEGDVIVARGKGLALHRLDRVGRESLVVSDAAMTRICPDGRMITGVAAAADGTVYAMLVDDASGSHSVVAVRPDREPQLLARDFMKNVQTSAANQPVEGNPCRGLACDTRGSVVVAATARRCVVQIDRSGATRVLLESPPPWSPTAVTFQGDDLLVLEYTDRPPDGDPQDRRLWVPRVRRVSPTGDVSLVVEIKRQ